MTARARILAYGSAALLIVAGAICAAAVGGTTGEVLATVLIGLGFIGITGLVFLGVSSFVQDMFYGGALVLAVTLSQIVRGREEQQF